MLEGQQKMSPRTQCWKSNVCFSGGMEIWSRNSTLHEQLLVYYILFPFAGLSLLVAVIIALACHLRKRRRFDELRHKLIPLYEYDPGEQEVYPEEEEEDEWDDKDEEEQLTEPLCGEEVGVRGKLSIKQD